MKSKHSKQNANKEINNNNQVEFYNNTLGENASEEHRSEEYSNAQKDNRNSGIK